jgi:uncharacterized membrane protein YedE/YeeE
MNNTNEPVLAWWPAGLLLGALLVLATALVKPLGVSTQYVVTNALVLHTVAPEWTSTNSYLTKYGEKDEWSVGYGWMLVIGMPIGGALAAIATRRIRHRPIPERWEHRFGKSRAKRFAVAFMGGVLLLFGARLAGGCTSGHMISGVAQLAVSSLIFTAALFPAAIFVTRLLYGGDDA